MAFESGGLSATPLSLPSRAVRAAPALSQLRLLGFRVPKLFFLGGADGVVQKRSRRFKNPRNNFNSGQKIARSSFTDRGRL